MDNNIEIWDSAANNSNKGKHTAISLSLFPIRWSSSARGRESLSISTCQMKYITLNKWLSYMEEDSNRSTLTCFQLIPVWFKTKTLMWFSRGIPLILWDMMSYDKFRVMRAGNSLQIAAISCEDMLAQINSIFTHGERMHWYHSSAYYDAQKWNRVIQSMIWLDFSTSILYILQSN